uniref:Cystatin-A-like n=1 Tax=Crassostrea virginica TaxID=6565 RepID=A0A8B8A4U2_CRAVI|nr:cystatin-A-like [Crassostrea virginica]
MQTLVALFLGLACVVVSDVSAVIRRPGGLSATKLATPEIQELVDSLRGDIILELPLGYDRERPLRLTAVSYKSQVVAGTNYFIKVETGWDRYIHVRIYRDLHGNASVSSVQLNKSADDVIGYF